MATFVTFCLTKDGIFFHRLHFFLSNEPGRVRVQAGLGRNFGSILMPIQLATLQLATLQHATLQLTTLQLATLQLATLQHATLQLTTLQLATLQLTTLQLVTFQLATLTTMDVVYYTVDQG
jgi:hypothetical protein